MANHFGNLYFLSNNFKLEIYAKEGLTQNYSIPLPPNPPTDNQTWKYNSATQQFEWTALAPNINLSLSAPNNEFNVSGSPYTGGTGSLSFSWKNQTQNLFFASPNASSGVPSFRAILDADLPTQISASRINGVLTKANIPDGTNSTSFQIDSANSGIVLKNDTSALKVFNFNQTSLADVYCKKLYVQDGIDQSTVTTVNLGDSTLLLNSEFVTGTPTVNSGLSIRRGSSTNSTIWWNEGIDAFECGVDDNLKTITRKAQVTITNTDLVSGNYTFNHNLRERYPTVKIADSTNRDIGLDITYTNTNTCVINFSRLTPIAGSWTITAIG